MIIRHISGVSLKQDLEEYVCMHNTDDGLYEYYHRVLDVVVETDTFLFFM